jgi:hypothetical protein
MLLTAFTISHVVISVIAILTGIIFTSGLLTNQPLNVSTPLFLVTTTATSITGFLFPVTHFMPSHGVGSVSLFVLALAVYALYGRRLASGWRKTFVVAAETALYLNVFVGLVQAFAKVPALKQLAPTQTENPFKLAQLGLLATFIVIGSITVIRFRGEIQRQQVIS